MHQEVNAWPAVRFVHLTGGCRAYNGAGPPVTFEPDRLKGGTIVFQARSYATFFADLALQGLSPIGVDFYTSSLEADGITPPGWRSFHDWATARTKWPCQDAIDEAGFIAHAARVRKNLRTWDLAHRVSHQLHVCAWRLRQVSEAYRDQLRARLKSGDFRFGGRFEDGFTWLAYLSVQAFLVDACVLRDYLSEFYATLICEEQDLIGSTPITSIGGLIRRVLSKSRNSDALTRKLIDATSPKGWLYTLGAYRDLVVHCAPLASADSRLVALCDELRIGSASIPAVTLPIPKDPVAASQARASGEIFRDPQAELQQFISANRGDAPSTDGLIYCYIALDQLARLTTEMLKRSPIPPEIPHLTEKDLAGPIKVWPDRS